MARRWIALGAVLGGVFGAWDLVATARSPLADDSPSALLMFYGPMFATWIITAFIASRRRQRITDGLQAGALVALSTFVVLDLAVMIRANVFLDVLPGRDDWQFIMRSFQTSGFSSFRTYVNWFYLKEAPLQKDVATGIGASLGALGGLAAVIARRISQRPSR